MSQKTEFMGGKSLYTASLQDRLIIFHEFFISAASSVNHSGTFSGVEIKIVVIILYKMHIYLSKNFIPT